MPKHLRRQRNRPIRGKLLLGGRLLRRFLVEKEETIPEFAKRVGLTRFPVQAACAGLLKRVHVDFAVAVEDGTRGFVPVRAWLSQTLETVSGETT